MRTHTQANNRAHNPLLINPLPSRAFFQTGNQASSFFTVQAKAPQNSKIMLQRQAETESDDLSAQMKFVQTKLTIGEPNDEFEREADSMADTVMRMPETKTDIQASSCNVGQQPTLQKQTAAVKSPTADTLPSANAGTTSPGQPLDNSNRQFFESRFGQDFSHVRLHTDTQAVQTSKALNAKAFTVGNNIAFGANQYQPNSNAGKHLLAHELTHVIQQSRITPRIQRLMGWEFQTHNKVTTNKGKSFVRKAGGKTGSWGKYFHKGKTGVELQTDTDSVIEFVTEPFQRWSDLGKQIEEAKQITDDLNKDPKKFPFSEQATMLKSKALARGETLEADIGDPTFTAKPQMTEGIVLSEFGSFMRQHNKRSVKGGKIVSLGTSGSILQSTEASNKAGQALTAAGITSSGNANLLGFMELIAHYLLQTLGRDYSADPDKVVKAHFLLMHRMPFTAMHGTLTAAEQKLFGKIVKGDHIPTAFGMSGTDDVFKFGYWVNRGKHRVLVKLGKIVKVATDTGIHNCSSKTKTKGVPTRWCGKAYTTPITIASWLKSMQKSTGKDQLSPPDKGSDSLGKWEISTSGPEKGLSAFEMRGFPSKKAADWVSFADAVFNQATQCRPGSNLVYDGKSTPFDKKKCP
jgi:hypothetical protein